ncbi:hypothetical protein FOCG_02012 [Fusarium oxysporum f. sp. radicis-lycopersici 26381]|nr:hypothetical protein FOWG_00214 [Fusarium oxysporum f. sp. lycopersici MN25]EXL58499.1 hypothetical protein FOCG_02012 [Fusarium oxysporum f. sp. radicis-lycopersici 26381]
MAGMSALPALKNVNSKRYWGLWRSQKSPDG